MASYLAGADVRPRLVLCSSGLRARQTLGAVVASLGDRLEIRIEPELYTFDAELALARLRRIPGDVASVLLVGHNPALQELALRLAPRGTARDRVASKLPTGALVTIALPDEPWADLDDGTGRIEALVTPRDLEAD